MRLIDDWQTEIRRLWTIRVALFWAALSGLYCVWPAFQGLVPLVAFALISVGMSLAICVARLMKQPGAADE